MNFFIKIRGIIFFIRQKNMIFVSLFLLMYLLTFIEYEHNILSVK